MQCRARRAQISSARWMPGVRRTRSRVFDAEARRRGGIRGEAHGLRARPNAAGSCSAERGEPRSVPRDGCQAYAEHEAVCLTRRRGDAEEYAEKHTASELGRMLLGHAVQSAASPDQFRAMDARRTPNTKPCV